MVADLVRRSLQQHPPAQGAIEVMEGAIRQDDNWWYVPVRPEQQRDKTYQYYQDLVDVEQDLKENAQVDVLLVPAA